MSPSPESSRPPTSPILVADGHADTRSLFCDSLRKAGRDVVEAADGRDALEKARSQRPSLVVTDTCLPALDGYALCEILRHDSMTSTVPILVVTEDKAPSAADRARRAGADAVLVKPVTPEVLWSEIDRLLELILVPAQRPERRQAERRQARVQQRAPLVCPQCGLPLRNDGGYVATVRWGLPDRWDGYRCPGGCGAFAYHPRTRSLRHVD